MADYIRRLRETEKDEKYKNFSVFPQTQNAELFPVKYLYSTDDTLRSLLGYDTGTSMIKLETITEAVITGEPTMTRLLNTIGFVAGTNKQGYMVFLPVYRNQAINEIPELERRALFVGLVFVWVDPQTLLMPMAGTVVDKITGLRFSVFDGENKLFSAGDISSAVPGLTESKIVKLLNKEFRFEFVGTSQLMESTLARIFPQMVLFGIVFVNIIWYLTAIIILRSWNRAVKLAEEATKDLKKFKLAVEGASDHIVITDKGGVITFANNAAERVTGYSVKEMVGKNPSLWGRQMSRDYYQSFWKTIKIDRKPFYGEIVNKRKDGELYEADIHVSPILDSNGELLFFVGIERDVSKVKAVDKMKMEFISLASHQLRTPLSAVKWFGEMLSAGDAGKLGKMQSEYLNKINQANEREIQLVNSLLNVSRIESGKIKVRTKKTDLKKLVEDVVNDLRAADKDDKRKYTISVDPKIPVFDLDSDLIRHVYINLLTNAMKYSDNKTGVIKLKVRVKEGWGVSSIEDNGIGIPYHEQKKNL